MGSDRQVELTFASGRAGQGPATWGQQAIWAAVRDLGPDAARYNIASGYRLSPELPVEATIEVLRELVLRHDSLRTRLPERDDGGLVQEVAGDGTMAVLSRQCAPDEIDLNAWALYTGLGERPFDVVREWPLRVALVGTGGYVHYVLFSVSHTASDGWGVRNLILDLARLAAGGPDSGDPHRLQPLAEAAYQCSDRGRRRDEAARRSWLRKLGSGPTRLFPARAGSARADKFPHAVLNSPALALAMDRVSSALAASPTAVLLAAAAAAAGRLGGTPEMTCQLVVNNRFLPGLADSVGTVAQEGLFRLVGTHGALDDLVARTFGAMLSAQQHAYYDKLALDRDIVALRDRGGPVGDHSCIINDYRGIQPRPTRPGPAPGPLAEARERTTVHWPVEFDPRSNVTFALDARDAPGGGTELALTADSSRLPRTDMERLLRGIEDLVVDHALALGAD